MKAILVINMPTICSNCVLEQNCIINHKSYSYCGVCGITTKHGYLLKDCPLKPMPQKKEIYEKLYQAYGLGNDETYQKIVKVVDEILGEAE